MALPKTPSFRLDGKTALITGASSGIGRAAAVALAEAGAHVTVAARRADALDQLVAELQDAGHSAVHRLWMWPIFQKPSSWSPI